MAYDANDLLREKGGDAVRAAFDAAKPYVNGAAALKSQLETGLKSGALLPDGYVSIHQLGVEPPRDLIKGVWPHRGLGFVVGQSGAGKSCIMGCSAVALAAGTEWFGLPVRGPVGVLYYASEGYASMARRLAAELKHRGIDKPLPIVLARGRLNLSDDKDFAVFVKEQQQVDAYFRRHFDVPLGVTIIDTIAAAASLRDENSNAEVAALCSRLRQAGDANDSLIIGVHHLGKNADAGPRGASASRASADQILSVLADRDENTGSVGNRRVVISKARDGAEGPISNFDLIFVELGVDEFNEPFGAVVAEPSGTPQGRPTARKETKTQRVFREAFNEVVSMSGREHVPWTDADIPAPSVMSASVQAVREEFERRYATGETGKDKTEAARKAFKRALDAVESYGFETVEGVELIWRA